MTNMMDQVFGQILDNANETYNSEKADYPYLEKLLRYYKDDIPKQPRYSYDGDAVYFYNYDETIKKNRDLSNRGDVMMSFWMPVIYCLGICKEYRKTPKDNRNLKKVLDLLENFDENILEKIEVLSQNYWTRGNLLLLPNSKNKKGYRNLNPNRAMWYEDKIDQTLWHCFKDGNLSIYFSNDDKNVVNWIRSERLECLFSETFFNNELEDILKGNCMIEENIHVCKNNLQPLLPGKDISSYKFLDIDNMDDWKEFFNRINKIIAYRNKNKPNSHIPFEWK